MEAAFLWGSLSGCSRLLAGWGELRSPGKLKHAPPMLRSCAEMAKLQGRLKGGCRQDCLPHREKRAGTA